MKVCGIVCEYNPFHNGHLYHIEETKKKGIDAIICVMSGNFVQRADFAIMRKHARAEAAIRAGADAVFELPVPWSLASAERFAYGAVSLLDALGVISHISFGCESNDLSSLKEIANLLSDPNFIPTILDEYSKGVSFASARELAVARFHPELSSLLSSPNNILAIEYLKALSRLNSSITPISVSRHGASHDDDSISECFASASAIRTLLSEKKDISDLVPAAVAEIWLREVKLGHAPVFLTNADSAIMSALKRLSATDFLAYGDVSEGLEHRLVNCISKENSLFAAIDAAKTKRYAHSRIRRIFLNAFLGVENHLSEGPVPYARLLAFNETGRKIIKNAKKTTKIPIISRPSSIKNESKRSKDLLALENRCDDIYSLFMQAPVSQGSVYTTSPLFITEE